MAAIIYISFLLACVYAILMLLYRFGWQGEPAFCLAQRFVPSTFVSVIVPARNEAPNIAGCIDAILQQDYPVDRYEVVVVDDHSTDNTAEIVKSYTDGRVKYVSLAEHIIDNGTIVAYKKQALAAGIAASTGTLIVTTDADCTAGNKWLRQLAAKYETEKPLMIVAPVSFSSDNSLVQVFQSLDFMSMQGITAATLRLKLGNMCNGANLAFEKQAYEQVGGYRDIDHIASGDDYLLMMKLNKSFPGAISYLKSAEAIVSTPPQPDWRSFLNQRIRWASKSGKYDDNKMTVVLMLVYLLNLSLLPAGIYSVVYSAYLPWFAAALFIKVAAEMIYLFPVARFFKKTRQLIVFPLLQPLHIIYIVLAGFLGFIGIYSWKGRRVK